MHKLHAEHNEELCKKIVALNDYDDWVVTTAFYSCIHYVEHKIFPFNDGVTTYNTFDQYFASKVISGGLRKSKHNLKLDLVKTHLAPVSTHYKRLMDNCFTARYKNYRVGKTLAQIAVNDLAKIKSACI